MIDKTKQPTRSTPTQLLARIQCARTLSGEHSRGVATPRPRLLSQFQTAGRKLAAEEASLARSTALKSPTTSAKGKKSKTCWRSAGNEEITLINHALWFPLSELPGLFPHSPLSTSKAKCCGSYLAESFVIWPSLFCQKCAAKGSSGGVCQAQRVPVFTIRLNQHLVLNWSTQNHEKNYRGKITGSIHAPFMASSTYEGPLTFLTPFKAKAWCDALRRCEPQSKCG